MPTNKEQKIEFYKTPSMGAEWPSFVATIANLTVTFMIKDNIDEDSALNKAIELYNKIYKRCPEFMKKEDK